jgi:hypothetical protein
VYREQPRSLPTAGPAPLCPLDLGNVAQIKRAEQPQLEDAAMPELFHPDSPNALRIDVYLSGHNVQDELHRATVENPTTSGSLGMVIITFGKELHRVIQDRRPFTNGNDAVLIEMFPLHADQVDTETVNVQEGTIRPDVVTLVRVEDGE